MSDLLNILGDSNKDIDNQKLMDYLSGKLSEKEKHDVEKQMADNEMLNDAVEGLQQFKDKKKAEMYADQLQKQLQQYIREKKARREKRTKIIDNQWIYLAILLVIALAIIAYVVISKMKTG